jgi:hypothetical protein
MERATLAAAGRLCHSATMAGVADGFPLWLPGRQRDERRRGWWDRVRAAPAPGVSSVLAPGRGRRPASRGAVPAAQPDRMRGPELAVHLLASRASQPAERIDPPAGRDRAGADVGLAERRRIGVPGDARAYLAPHDRYPQLVADHRSLGDPHAGVRGRAGAGCSTRRFRYATVSTGRPGAAPSGHRGVAHTTGLSVFGTGRLGVPVAARPSVLVAAQFGEPVSHLVHAGVIWPHIGHRVQALPVHRGARAAASA